MALDFRYHDNMDKVQTIEKLPPQNLEAEQSFLGSLLIDKDAIIKVADIVTEHDFYKDGNRLLYGAIVELYSRHEPIDIISLTNILEEKNRLEAIGGGGCLPPPSQPVATPPP